MADATGAVQIQPQAAGSALTPAQARFNALARDVAALRVGLAAWQDRLDRYHRAVEPLQAQLRTAWRDWVLALDSASLQPGLSRLEQAQLEELAGETAAALLEEEGDVQLADVVARHARGQEGAQGASETAAPEPDAEDWEQQAAAAAAHRELRAAQRRAASQRKRQAREAQVLSQSVREVYRRLASALHPDRETDPVQRERKTRLMQQANDAHARGDLLGLLDLQLQAEEIDAAHLQGINAVRLQHYITVLEEQLVELKAESQRIESGFRAAVGLRPGTGLQARKLDRQVSAQAQRLRADLADLRAQTQALADIDTLTDWLRQLRKG